MFSNDIGGRAGQQAIAVSTRYGLRCSRQRLRSGKQRRQAEPVVRAPGAAEARELRADRERSQPPDHAGRHDWMKEVASTRELAPLQLVDCG